MSYKELLTAVIGVLLVTDSRQNCIHDNKTNCSINVKELDSIVVDWTFEWNIWKVVLLLIASCLAICTSIGNLLVLESFRINKQLRTVSNYFLLSLAIADLTIGLVSIPIYTAYFITEKWLLGQIMCELWLCIDYTMSNASVANLLLISFDRYFSVTRPLTYRAKRTSKKAAIMITLGWVVSFLLWTPIIIAWPFIYGKRTTNELECKIQFLDENTYLTLSTCLIAFYIPVTIMSILYFVIYLETLKRQKDVKHLQATQNRFINQKKSLTDFSVSSLLPQTQTTSTSINTNNPNIKHIKINNSNNSLNDAIIIRDYRSINKKRELKHRLGLNCCKDIIDHDDVDGVETDSGSSRRITKRKDNNDMHVSLSQSTIAVPQHQHRQIIKSKSFNVTKFTNEQEQIYTILIELPTKTTTTTKTQNHKFRKNLNIETTTTTTVKQVKITELGLDLEKRIFKSDSNIFSHCDDQIKVLNKRRSSCAIPNTRPITPTSQNDSIRKFNQRHNIALNNNNININQNNNSNNQNKKTEKRQDQKAAKTLSAILLAFIITWLPYNINVVIIALLSDNLHLQKSQIWNLWVKFAYWLCYINSTVNPVLYAMCNINFRRTFKRILTCNRGK